ncbi:hypothetical protein [Psychrobacter communis]|uniref:DUF11 domain-containing protein n=1 Tax=Psychrobacter communis TaxID=2762238 RepID=A0ABR8RLL0_9GAMM|nr:hypothetical protein [Psychrobacter communis]MBD7948686.1 hypothetical protein [Psychrobacter communis]
MQHIQRFPNLIGSQSLSGYVCRMLFLLIVMALLFVSNRALALTANPGATCRGIMGAAQGSLLNNDYTNLVNALNTNNFVRIMGNDSGRIPLEIKISTVESSPNTTLSNFGVIDSGSNRAINVRRNFPSVTAYTDINFEFRNTITNQPINLSNVALSAFDIDYSNATNSLFDDYIKITGITESGNTINGTFQSINGSNVVDVNGLNNSTSNNCPPKNLDTGCQGSIQFTQAVNKITIRYTNNPTYVRNTPTNQEIDFRVDNYCYIPEYIFSGTVFDDNGGIASNRASKENADITTTTSPYTNNSDYFNGVFNTSSETGITGSSVKLVNCTNPATVYATQQVAGNGTTIGQYQFNLPLSTFNGSTDICVIEDRTNGISTYPIRTSSAKINIGFAATTFNYINRNFGRVIPANAALVLRKAQFVNDCPSTLDYTASTLNTPGNTNPRTGFSESSIGENSIIPGQCIAYRITATNRSNLVINDFIMQDKLQKKGVEGALITSVLIGPVFNSSEYASNSVVIGQNNPVITKPLVLSARDNKVFYFNTKYGTTVDP